MSSGPPDNDATAALMEDRFLRVRESSSGNFAKRGNRGGSTDADQLQYNHPEFCHEVILII